MSIVSIGKHSNSANAKKKLPRHPIRCEEMRERFSKKRIVQGGPKAFTNMQLVMHKRKIKSWGVARKTGITSQQAAQYVSARTPIPPVVEEKFVKFFRLSAEELYA